MVQASFSAFMCQYEQWAGHLYPCCTSDVLFGCACSLFFFSSRGPSAELPPWWRAALVVAEMPTMSWTSLSTRRTVRCGVFVHGNVARRAGNSAACRGLECGRWCGTAVRHAALMNLCLEVFVNSLKGPCKDFAAWTLHQVPCRVVHKRPRSRVARPSFRR